MSPRQQDQQVDQRHANIAWCAQLFLERHIIDLARNVVDRTGIRRICLTGGVANNVKMCGELLKQRWVDDVFGDPFAGDAGVALAAARHSALLNDGTAWGRLDSVNLTASLDGEEISRIVHSSRWAWSRPADLESVVAAILARGEFVAWFQGRMEAGPRALGHRSLLADPRTETSGLRLNLLKGRETWRPLAPAMTDDWFYRFYSPSRSDPFMTAVRYVVPELEGIIPGAVHVDRTFRPQVVSSEGNPRFYRLIKEFGALSGVECVLNTSFNMNGEPIVESPEDALLAFERLPIRFLVIGDFLLDKERGGSAMPCKSIM
jgi:carbamoyltransferase